MQANRDRLVELQAVITKMPLEVCSVAVQQDFQLRWKDLSRTIRNSKLPLNSASVARIICIHVSKAMEPDELDDILRRLKLRLVASKERTWHVINLIDPINEDVLMTLPRDLPHRVLQAFKGGHDRYRHARPVVECLLLDDLLYLSIQLTLSNKGGSVLYCATPPGLPVAVVSNTASAKILTAFAQGLGYTSYKKANLYGKDIPSLLRIADPYSNSHLSHLSHVPPYDPTPCILPNGIDYTYKTYNERYIDHILGPNPPLLTDLNLTTEKYFFNRNVINKKMKIKIALKSENVAATLKSWVVKGIVVPNSEFFTIFQHLKSNNLVCNDSDSD